MKFRTSSAALAVSVGLMLVHVAYPRHAISQPAPAEKAVPTIAYAFGEIKAIDTEWGTVTLKHGPIENLGMPDMTMIFHAVKSVQITSFKVGDKVRFKADKVQGAFVVTELAALN